MPRKNGGGRARGQTIPVVPALQVVVVSVTVPEYPPWLVKTSTRLPAPLA